MKKIFVIIIISAIGGLHVQAQRPVGDTIVIGGGGYLYNPLLTSYLYCDHLGNTVFHLDPWYYEYIRNTWLTFSGTPSQCTTAYQNYLLQHSDRATVQVGTHITGQEFSLDEDVMVIGLAVCPTIYEDLNLLHTAGYLPRLYIYGPVDTTLANRETEYVQLYTIEGGQPQFQAEGAWRWDYPHRYMAFPSWHPIHGPIVNYDTLYVALFETMFDTGILIDSYKSSIMVAGTHNNNASVWSRVEAGDTVYPDPRLCWEHYPTTYSCIENEGYAGTWWVTFDTLPWVSYSGMATFIGGLAYTINIFPILDTLFGTPCAAVTGLDTAEVDSVQATLMWSADARHHGWEVWYRPTVDSIDSSTVLTTSVPTVTLTGLMPGVEYSVAVRGLCDIENYSPWCDTLLFTTPHDTTQIIDTNTIDTTQTQDIRRLGNLDRFTRIMPNPAHDVVNVLSSYRLESVAVYDLTGRQLLEQPADGISTVVDVSALPRGTYIMAIRTQQGVATKKLVVADN